MRHPLLLAALALPIAATAIAAPTAPAAHAGMIKVAFALTPHANVMDIAGPWEVFADTSVKDANGEDVAPYALYTVSATTAPLHSAGGDAGHLTLTPDYDFAHAPAPDIVVVPAQMGGPALETWLKKIHGRHAVIMSVCTGAFVLGKAGLLEGKPATTHHWYFGNFAREFPGTKLVKQVRYAQSDPITFTAGGLTSGVDLALHLVDRRFGRDVAQQTADFMEYLGTGWKTNAGIPPMDLPVKREDWAGRLDGGGEVVIHEVTYGASPVFTVDIPAQHVNGAPVRVTGKDPDVRLVLDLPEHPATIAGRVMADGKSLAGTFTQDGAAHALTLSRRRTTD